MNADPIARAYRWIEYAAFGRSLERCRFATLPFTAETRTVLILGEGDGRFLARLLRGNARATVDVIDASARMLELARGRVPDGPAGSDSYELIVTNFFLNCFSPVTAAALIAKWAGVLKPGGLWLVGEFNEPESGIRRLHARVWRVALYRFFQLTTKLEASRLPPYTTLLASANLALVERNESRFGLMISQVWRKNAG